MVLGQCFGMLSTMAKSSFQPASLDTNALLLPSQSMPPLGCHDGCVRPLKQISEMITEHLAAWWCGCDWDGQKTFVD